MFWTYILICLYTLNIWLLMIFGSYKYESEHDKTNKMACAPSDHSDQPGICPVWSESSLCGRKPFSGGQRRLGSPRRLICALVIIRCQTGWMSRLIWVFAGRTYHFVGFYMLRLIGIWRIFLFQSNVFV